MPSSRNSNTVAVAKYSQWPLRLGNRKRASGVSLVVASLSGPSQML